MEAAVQQLTAGHIVLCILLFNRTECRHALI